MNKFCNTLQLKTNGFPFPKHTNGKINPLRHNELQVSNMIFH